MNTKTCNKTIACMGDSITYGHGVSASRESDAWTFVLQRMLGAGYEVLNFGINGAAAIEDCPESYRKSGLLDKALRSGADTFTLMLGSNDTKERLWDKAEYEDGMRGLIEDVLMLRADSPELKLFVMLPPAAFPGPDGQTAYGVSGELIVSGVIPVINALAAEYDLHTIDLYTPTRDHPEFYSEGVHPNAGGNRAIAEEMYKALCAEAR